MERDAMERARKEQTDKVEHEWRPGAEYVGRCDGGGGSGTDRTDISAAEGDHFGTQLSGARKNAQRHRQ
jgi:hypothetical protein